MKNLDIVKRKNTMWQKSGLLRGLVVAVLISLLSGIHGAKANGPQMVDVSIVSISPNPVFIFRPTVVTVNVFARDPQGSIPTGKVEITAGHGWRCTAELDPQGGGSCTITPTLPGVVPLKAIYLGSSGYLPEASQTYHLNIELSDQPVVFYQHDFETPVGNEWCKTKRDTTPIDQRTFLGQFAGETTCLTLSNLPLHDLIFVSFDLYIIRSWNGNQVKVITDPPPGAVYDTQDALVGPDEWLLKAYDIGHVPTTLLHTSFSNYPEHPQAYPDDFPLGDYPRFTGAVETNSLGYTFTGRPMDSVYHLEMVFAHTNNTLQLDFISTSFEDVLAESWGIDNIVINVAKSDAYSSLPIPLKID